MKKTQIVLIVLVAAVLGVLVVTYSDLSTSVSFDKAFENPGKEYKISGILDKTQPVIYDPKVNSNQTVFSITDKDGRTERVYLSEAKPQGLEQSESVDLYGSVVEGEFRANKMLMKCPSKYNDQQHVIEGTAQNGQ